MSEHDNIAVLVRSVHGIYLLPPAAEGVYPPAEEGVYPPGDFVSETPGNASELSMRSWFPGERPLGDRSCPVLLASNGTGSCPARDRRRTPAPPGERALSTAAPLLA